jgi:hypothetical protein
LERGDAPKERRDSRDHDLLRSRLDQIVDPGHPLAKLARTIDWDFLEQRLGAVYTDHPGRPPLPTRLMAGLAILKHMHNLSDEVLCERLAGEPVLSAALRRGVLLPPFALRPFLAYPLTPAHGECRRRACTPRPVWGQGSLRISPA